MPSRRALLRTGGAAALAALAGCQSVPTSFRETTQPFRETTRPESSAAGDYRLDADLAVPRDVADGEVVGVASPGLYDLVADAADRDGRVDLDRGGSADRDEALALGAFEYLAFAGETYEPTASFAGFGEESTTEFSLAVVAEDEVDGNVTVTPYESLDDREQAVVDRMVNESITVGRYEEGRPDGVGGVVSHDYVRVGNDTYQPRITVADPPPHHMLALDPANLDGDATVATVLDERPAADWSAVLQAGLGSGSAGIDDVPSNEALVAYIGRVDYVTTAARIFDVSVTEVVQ